MKTALVTGTSRGLGNEIARLLAERGYHVLTPGRDKLDISDVTSIAKYVRSCHRMDVLVNNAAVLVENMNESVKVNAMGAYFLTKQLWPMLKYTKGKVVNISSREGLSGETFGNRAYSVSKATLNAITRVMAKNDDEVSVTACCPGWFRSRMGGDLAPISPAEAADTPVWLAAEAMDINGKFFINRQVVPW